MKYYKTDIFLEKYIRKKIYLVGENSFLII